MKLTNKAYDILNAIVQIVLPGSGTLYFALSGIWGLPNSEKVVGTITAVDTFLGLIQAWLKKNYKPETDGTVIVDKTDPEGDKLSFQLNRHPEEITPGSHYLLDVKEHTPLPSPPQHL